MVRKRKGVSPVIASTLLIAVTLAVGIIVWSFVIGQASVASGAMGESTASNVNYLRERFVIANVAYNPGEGVEVAIWFYNNGGVDTEIVEIFMGESETQMYPVTVSALSLPYGETAYTTFNSPAEIGGIVDGSTYYFRAVAKYGNIVTYYQEA